MTKIMIRMIIKALSNNAKIIGLTLFLSFMISPLIIIDYSKIVLN